jgi:hypothetical protein
VGIFEADSKPILMIVEGRRLPQTIVQAGLELVFDGRQHDSGRSIFVLKPKDEVDS